MFIIYFLLVSTMPWRRTSTNKTTKLGPLQRHAIYQGTKLKKLLAISWWTCHVSSLRAAYVWLVKFTWLHRPCHLRCSRQPRILCLARPLADCDHVFGLYGGLRGWNAEWKASKMNTKILLVKLKCIMFLKRNVTSHCAQDFCWKYFIVKVSAQKSTV